MKNRLILFILLLIHVGYLYSQDICGAPEALKINIREYPGLNSYIQKYLEKLDQRIKNFPFNPELHQSPVTIPIVVHVVYKNVLENVSDTKIYEQIEILNQAYRNLNSAEINGIPDVFKPDATDAYIQFRLASRDPLGNATTGITRKSTTKSYYDMVGNEVKLPPYGVLAWDPKRYLNIWVCDLRWNGDDGLNGYGSFPQDSITILDGVAMDFGAFGMNSSNPSRNKGKTLIHEIGHYFGLNHIWGDSNCGDDHVSDTPTQQDHNYSPPVFPHITCGNTPRGDMFMNFMDYTNDPARVMFTAGQRIRMLANVAPGGRRASLAVSNALFPVTAVSREYEVFLEPQNNSLPSWKASLIMTHAWACQCSPALDNLLQQNVGKRGSKYKSMGNDIADVVYALALNPEEMLACYTIEGFYQKLNRGPITILSIGGSEYYGLVVYGIVMDKTNGRALLKIKDPMGIGPSGFFIVNQTGSDYQVDYNEFMTKMLEKAVINNKHIYIVYPPSSTKTL